MSVKSYNRKGQQLDFEFLFCFFSLNCFLFNFGHIFFLHELVRQHRMKNISLYTMLIFTSFILFNK